MARLSVTVIVMLILVGCTSSSLSPTSTVESSVIVDPTVAEPTSSPAEIPDTGNPTEYTIQEYPVPPGTHPHDIAPAPDGSVWYTAQFSGALGRLDPATGETHHIPLGVGSAPHGVIVGPDDAPWITDGGLNAIVRVDPQTEEIQKFPLPAEKGNANLNTAAFDRNGILWFTGQNGVYGSLDPSTGEMQAFDAPRGRGPYGITVTPEGMVYYASLAGSYVGRIDPPGPVFYRPRMVGADGKVFSLFRFRTMYLDLSREHQFTRVGRFIRNYSLDHLPQLLNLLKGDLTLIGPRPMEVDVVDLQDPTWQQYVRSKPGLINYAIYKLGKEWTPSRSTQPELNQELELRYQKQRSIASDAILFLRSLWKFIASQGNIKARGDTDPDVKQDP